MSKKLISLLILVCCSVIVGLVFAEDKGELSLDWDEEALKNLPHAERLAYKKADMARLMAAARERGWVPGKKRAFEPVGRQAAPPNKAAGTITYHSGAIGPCCIPNNVVGNQFDFALNTAMTAISPVMMSGSITMATFEMVALGAPNIVVAFYGPVAGSSAPLRTFFSVSASTGVNTFSLTYAYTGSSFLAGVWNFTPFSASPAVATGTVGGQGFHGMSLASGGLSFVTLGTLNGAISVSGNVLTPVELLNFEIE